jgi:hypothetical protein
MCFSPLLKLNEHPFHHPTQEVQLLEKHLGYSLLYKLKHSALAAKAASTFANLNGQECLWFTVQRNIKLLINRNKYREYQKGKVYV